MNNSWTRKITKLIALLIIIATASHAYSQKQVLVKSTNGVDWLYEVFDSPEGGYKVRIVIANNTDKTLTTSGDYRLDFQRGAYWYLSAGTVRPKSRRNGGEMKFKDYPQLTKWSIPAYTLK